MKKSKAKHKGMRIAAAAPSLRIDKKVEASKTRKPGEPAEEVMPEDRSHNLNFTKDSKPRLNASTGGEGAMGQRR